MYYVLKMYLDVNFKITSIIILIWMLTYLYIHVCLYIFLCGLTDRRIIVSLQLRYTATRCQHKMGAFTIKSNGCGWNKQQLTRSPVSQRVHRRRFVLVKVLRKENATDFHVLTNNLKQTFNKYKSAYTTMLISVEMSYIDIKLTFKKTLFQPLEEVIFIFTTTFELHAQGCQGSVGYICAFPFKNWPNEGIQETGCDKQKVSSVDCEVSAPDSKEWLKMRRTLNIETFSKQVAYIPSWFYKIFLSKVIFIYLWSTLISLH